MTTAFIGFRRASRSKTGGGGPLFGREHLDKLVSVCSSYKVPPPMKTCLVLIVGAVLLFSGCATARDGAFVKRSDEIQSFTLKTKGEPGQHFVAKLDVDGEEREIRGVTPAEYPLQACVLSGAVRKLSGEGTLGFTIISGKAQLGFGNSMKAPGSSLRFRYHDNGVEVWP